MSEIIFSKEWLELKTKEKKEHIKNKCLGLDLTIVYVDDDQDAIEVFNEKVESLGFSVYSSSNLKETLLFIKNNQSKIAMVISDYQMPEINGFEFRNEVAQINNAIPFVILSGFVDREMALKGIEYKISSFLEKPIELDLLVAIIQKEVEPRVAGLKDDHEMLMGFTEDAANLLEEIESLCLHLESTPSDTEAVARIFGMIHTIKGSSGFFNPRDLHEYAHAFEDLLKEVQNGIHKVTPSLISIWLKGLDQLKIFVDEFKSGNHKEYNVAELKKIFKYQETSESTQTQNNKSDQPQGGQVAKDEKSSEIKVSMQLLDEFMQISGEMTVIRNMLNKSVRSIEKQYQGDKDVVMLSELLNELHKINGEVQNKITDIRRVPASSLAKPLARTVRDTCRALNKEVQFEIEGEDLRLDNSIAEVLTKSLIHIMRNSIDHGIESKERRLQFNKNIKGHLALRFKQNEEAVFVEIEDDGGGINTEKIREKMVSKGMCSEEESRKYTKEYLESMIFDSGFSTAQQVTEFSGRGVGMSMVKDSVTSMNGKIHIHSSPGKGTKIVLEIPVPKSVLITNCLFIQSGDKSFGVPQDNISKIYSSKLIPESDLLHLEGRDVIKFNDHLLPIFSLSKMLNPENNCEEEIILILNSEKTYFALRVNKVLEIEDTVIKPLNVIALKNIGIYLGGTFLGDGTVGLIFNIDGMSKKLGVTNQITFQSKTNTVVSRNEENFIVFDLNLHGRFCISEKDVVRIENIETSHIQMSAGFEVLPYRGSVLNLYNLNNLIKLKHEISLEKREQVPTIIVNISNHFVGITVNSIVDLVKSSDEIILNPKKQTGILGCKIIDGQTVSLIDLQDIEKELCRKSIPEEETIQKAA